MKNTLKTIALAVITTAIVNKLMLKKANKLNLNKLASKLEECNLEKTTNSICRYVHSKLTNCDTSQANLTS